jgi:hypothetical protein
MLCSLSYELEMDFHWNRIFWFFIRDRFLKNCVRLFRYWIDQILCRWFLILDLEVLFGFFDIGFCFRKDIEFKRDNLLNIRVWDFGGFSLDSFSFGWLSLGLLGVFR